MTCLGTRPPGPWDYAHPDFLSFFIVDLDEVLVPRTGEFWRELRAAGGGGGGAGGSGTALGWPSLLKGQGARQTGPGRSSSLPQWQGADHLQPGEHPTPCREWSHVGISARGNTALRGSTRGRVPGAGGRVGTVGMAGRAGTAGHTCPFLGPQPTSILSRGLSLSFILHVRQGQAVVCVL